MKIHLFYNGYSGRFGTYNPEYMRKLLKIWLYSPFVDEYFIILPLKELICFRDNYVNIDPKNLRDEYRKNYQNNNTILIS